MPINSGLPKSKRKKLQSLINSHTNNTSNPHNTTKAQVGLGNVPNVTTNDQTPTYTVASSNSNLTSGEKLTVAMGKIAKAIASLITHLADTVSHITSKERELWNTVSDKANATTLENVNTNLQDQIDALKAVQAEVFIEKAEFEKRLEAYYADSNYIDPDSGILFAQTTYNITDDYQKLERDAENINYIDTHNIGATKVQGAIDILAESIGGLQFEILATGILRVHYKEA